MKTYETISATQFDLLGQIRKTIHDLPSRGTAKQTRRRQ